VSSATVAASSAFFVVTTTSVRAGAGRPCVLCRACWGSLHRQLRLNGSKIPVPMRLRRRGAVSTLACAVKCGCSSRSRDACQPTAAVCGAGFFLPGQTHYCMLTAICLLFLPANIVMEETRERRFGKGVYSDVMLGLYLVRGENIVLLGEVVSG
jgi:hypothetical protein